MSLGGATQGCSSHISRDRSKQQQANVEMVGVGNVGVQSFMQRKESGGPSAGTSGGTSSNAKKKDITKKDTAKKKIKSGHAPLGPLKHLKARIASMAEDTGSTGAPPPPTQEMPLQFQLSYPSQASQTNLQVGGVHVLLKGGRNYVTLINLASVVRNTPSSHVDGNSQASKSTNPNP